ncbi:MAG: energy transducer TonB [Planctomycetes bacterium]|nr:energy transducer TonB [Planctomycetota bacterium]
MSLLLQPWLSMTSHWRAVVASVALHGAGIAAALVWLSPGPLVARWASVRRAPLRSTIDFDAPAGPPTSAPLPEVPVEAEPPTGPPPLPEPEPEPSPTVIPNRVEATPAPVRDASLTWPEWRLRLRPPAPHGDTAPPPQPAAAAAQAEVLPSPIAGHNLPPSYPWVAWRRGIEGTVLVQLTIAADGSVTQTTVATSSGNAQLDDAALTALRAWRFAPAPPGDAAPRVHCRPVVFRLADH